MTETRERVATWRVATWREPRVATWCVHTLSLHRTHIQTLTPLSTNAHIQTHACLLEDEELLEELDDDEEEEDDDDDDDEEEEDDDDDESESEASAYVCWGGGGGERDASQCMILGSSSLTLSLSFSHALTLSYPQTHT
jgi:hypothetical protein